MDVQRPFGRGPRRWERLSGPRHSWGERGHGAGRAWRTDPADAAALRASYERTVAVAGRGPRIQPIPAHLP